MNLEHSLVLNRYLHSLFGADRFDDLRRVLKEQEEGVGFDGRSRFFHVLAGRSGLKIEARSLEEYDRRNPLGADQVELLKWRMKGGKKVGMLTLERHFCL